MILVLIYLEKNEILFVLKILIVIEIMEELDIDKNWKNFKKVIDLYLGLERILRSIVVRNL